MSFRHAADRWLGVAIEAMVLVLVVLSPWAFGAVEPIFEFFLYVGVAGLLLAWALRMLCQGEFAWKKDSAALCLAAMFLLGVGQLQPLPRPVLQFLSPHTVRLLDELLPAQPEALPSGATYQRPELAAGNSISLYPGATRKELVRLLAVFLVFVVVRNNVASSASLRRLFVVLVVNGCALAFFALFQFFTSPRDTVYWTFQTKGAVFGPFISRTHYPFYVNVCIGAGLGLLLSLVPGWHANRPGTRTKEPGTRNQGQRTRDKGQKSGAWLAGLLNDPPRLWLVFALAFMAGSVALSLSRGGFLAMCAGAGVLLLLHRARLGRFARISTGLVTLAAALALVSWMGGKRVEDRLATIWKGEAMEQSRLPLWLDSWPLVLEFPLTGTGYGTFSQVEPLHREHTSSLFVHEHAHNEYLEALIEGGVLRLGLGLLTIGLVFRAGWRAVRRHAGEPTSGLALGALFGFTALAVHSIGDFGLHLPAIALLAAVLCAQLMELGAEKTERAYLFRWSGAMVGVGALAVATLGVLLVGEGRRLERAQAYRLLAQRFGAKGDANRSLELLRGAAWWAPESGRVLTELAQAHLDRFEKRTGERSREQQAALAAQWVLNGAGLSPCLPGNWGRPSVDLTLAAWNLAASAEEQRLVAEQLEPGLQAYLQARDVCPLMPRPQFRLANHRHYLKQADPREAYLDRAKRVVTNDAELWFLFGAQEYLDGQPDRAARSWRRSLELSEEHLPRMLVILSLGREKLTPKVLAEEVLPDRPELLVRVAGQMFPGAKESEGRRPFLERALALLAAAPGSAKPLDLFLRGRIHAWLDQPDQALAAYRQALANEPRRAAWRLELANLLREQGQLTEARQEVLNVLLLEPGNSQAGALLDAVNRDMRKISEKTPPHRDRLKTESPLPN